VHAENDKMQGDDLAALKMLIDGEIHADGRDHWHDGPAGGNRQPAYLQTG
jgi:hypothetical protein